MTVTTNRTRRCFLVEGGVLKPQAEAYREARKAAFDAIWQYVQSIGGISYQIAADGGLRSVKFPMTTKTPKEFKKDKDGMARPRFRSRYADEFSALPRLPKFTDYAKDFFFATEVPFEVDADTKGVAPVGHPHDPIGYFWYDPTGPILVVLPDHQPVISALRRNHPNVVIPILLEGAQLQLEGLTEILPEEWNFMEARWHEAQAVAEAARGA